MKVYKRWIGLLLIAAMLTGWAPTADAWTFGIETYSYYGNEDLKGTIPGALYYTKAGVVQNDSSTDRDLVVDLYNGPLSGKYEYSQDEGANRIVIDPTVDTLSSTLASGATIWLRVKLYTDVSQGYHILYDIPLGFC